MRHVPLATLTTAFALGISLAMTGCPSRPDPLAEAQDTRPGAAPRAAASAPAADSDEEWMARLDTIAWQDADRHAVQELSDAVKGNEALREAVLQRYRRASDRAAKAALRMALAADPVPALVQQATAWAREGNPSEQADGLWLLAEIGPTEQTAALARRAVMQGQDPGLLMGALVALKPPEMPPPQEIPPVVARLRVLAQHDDPLVRALSVQKMAEWDRPRHSSPATIMKALGDRDPQVRQSAVVAVDMAALRTSDVKVRLLKLLDNPSEDLQVREAAAWVLEPFSLTPVEYATYRRNLHEVIRLLDETAQAGAQAQGARR
jgi:hypothetical protein